MSHHNIRLLWKQCIAAVLTLVLLSCLALPGFAAGKTDTVPVAAAVTVQAGKKKTIFIGDSRTANLRQVRMGGPLIKDLIQQDGSTLWDFKWGANFVDLTTNLLPRLELNGLDTIDGKTTIVVWMGYNDVINMQTATVNEYINLYKIMAALWTARGAKVYFMNLGPRGNWSRATRAQQMQYKADNKKLRSFNKKLKADFPSQAKYIDVYTYLVNSGYATTDGTHYSAATSKRIYNFVIKKIN